MLYIVTHSSTHLESWHSSIVATEDWWCISLFVCLFTTQFPVLFPLPSGCLDHFSSVLGLHLVINVWRSASQKQVHLSFNMAYCNIYPTTPMKINLHHSGRGGGCRALGQSEVHMQNITYEAISYGSGAVWKHYWRTIHSPVWRLFSGIYILKNAHNISLSVGFFGKTLQWRNIEAHTQTLLIMYFCLCLFLLGLPLRRPTPNQWANLQKWQVMEVHRGE